ncbi:hypothetical protein ACN47E_005951 [Coniothyrium glycines]
MSKMSRTTKGKSPGKLAIVDEPYPSGAFAGLKNELDPLQISDLTTVSNIKEADYKSDTSSKTGATNLDRPHHPNFDLMEGLVATKGDDLITLCGLRSTNRDIAHAPLISQDVIVQHTKELSQYGFLGSHCGSTQGEEYKKIFQNTNVPFSTFICGVQGSGKSHTTACMLENALIPSVYLGKNTVPVSALIFSYGDFSGGGHDFNISEAAYLALADKSFPNHEVRKVTILTSPSNPAIKRHYQSLPGVKIIPFKLKPKSLDVGTLQTLMAVNEKSEVPLYMAKVDSILRNIAMNSKSGVFDYKRFRDLLKLEKFDRTQSTMLDMRLDLLDSFLDSTGKAPEPKFTEGEMTIVDLSDPFVTPNTACIIFKLCLERFMQSRAPSKMVVLDEAHKYMLNTPGSTVLTDYLKTLIRLQRHKGVRVVISTQEPTVSTDLIALCSVTVVHRFTSPAWYAALRKHISAFGSDSDAMHEIENLETGHALVYCPNAVLGSGHDGILRKATGQMLKVQIRKRVTRDGGESIMAV